MDPTCPFRGSAAVALGLLTPKMLRGPRFRRLFPDVYVSACVETDLTVRSLAAHVLVHGRGVLAGYSAAEMLGASCGPADSPAEIVVPHRVRGRPGLRVREDVLPPDEITVVGGVPVTSALRTAFDLGRRSPVVEAVVAVDALARVAGFAPPDLVSFGYRHLGARGSAQLPEVVRLANPLAESPMETRIRMALLVAGLPLPVLQHRVGPYRLDMAYPAVQLAVEYDGSDQLDPERALRDLDRQPQLSLAGWEILRFRAYDVLRRPGRVADAVRQRLVLTPTALDPA
jgi:very-short-patch-repair endonuclease